MTIFHTSDPHFGHVKVAGIRAEAMGYSNANAADWVYLHDYVLISNWRDLVKPDDIVYVHGDISSGSTAGQIHALAILKDLPGRKRLIIGNHDGVHDMYRDAHTWDAQYRAVFESIHLHGRIRIPLAEGHVDALLSHFPYTGDHKPEDRHTQWRLRDEGLYVIHGHVHSEKRATAGGRRQATYVTYDPPLESLPPGSHTVTMTVGAPRLNQIHIGVDAWDFKPVSRDEIVTMIRQIEDGSLCSQWTASQPPFGHIFTSQLSSSCDTSQGS
jgi:calcineurin-like phosphoesterase family protein